MTDPLWVAVEERTFPTIDNRIEADVAVVGGGFSGLGAAWAAAQAGASVVLLEERTIASGASGRNAGFILSGPAMAFKASVAAIGLEETLEIWRLTDENHALLLSLLGEMNRDCGYLRRGSMSLAASEAEWDGLQTECRQMQEAGIHACLVPAGALPRPFDQLYLGGIYHAGNGEINPGAFLRLLAGSLASKVRIFEESPVKAIEQDVRVAVRCRAGSILADRVIIAINAYTRALLPDVPIVPTRGQVASTGHIDRVVAPFPMYADRGFQYWRQTAEGRLVVGGWRNLAMVTEVGADEVLNQSIQTALDQFIARTAPGARIERRWAGIMGFTPDHFPLVGAVPGNEGIFIAAGYSGHGVAMAFLCGALAARASLGQEVSIPCAFEPQRFAARKAGK